MPQVVRHSIASPLTTDITHLCDLKILSSLQFRPAAHAANPAWVNAALDCLAGTRHAASMVHKNGTSAWEWFKEEITQYAQPLYR